MSNGALRPSWLGRWLVRFAPLGHRRAEVEADLMDLLQRRTREVGVRAARRRYLLDALSLWGHRGASDRARPAGAGWVSSLGWEVRFAVRGAFRQPGSSLAIAATLAFVIATNTALFSIVDGLFLRPLPFRDSDALVSLQPSDLVTRDYEQLRQLVVELPESPLLAGVAFDGPSDAFAAAPDAVADLGLVVHSVSAGFFEVLGVAPFLGRFLDLRDDADGDPLPVVVGHRVWRSVLGADPAVVGTAVTLAGRRVLVLGVARPQFDYPRGANVWVPGGPAIASSYLRPWTLARLAPGVAVEPVRGRYPGLEVVALSEWIRPRGAQSVLFLFGATALLLLAAWVQVGALMLSRAAGRGAEVGLRLALGAGRRRLILQFVVEGAVLAVAALAAAWLATPALAEFITRQLPATVTAGQHLDPDGRTFGFAAALAVAGMMLLVVAPVDALRRAAPVVLLRGGVGTRRASADRVRTALLVAQIACTTLLLTLAGLALHSDLRASRVDAGFDVAGVWQFLLPSLPPELSGPAREAARLARQANVADTISALRAMDDVAGVGAANQPPLAVGIRAAVRRPDQPDQPPLSARANFVAPGYFEALGVRLEDGATFDAAAYRGQPDVAVVNRALASELSRTGPVLGQSIRAMAWTGRVVGVIADVIDGPPDVPREPQLVIPPLPTTASNVILIRLTTPSGTVPAPVASLLERQWGAFAPRRFTPLAEDVAALTAPWRARSILFGLIAALCVPLAVVGLAGALLHTVRSRHREIAIRLALGADPGRVRRAIVGRALASAGAGVFVGLAGGIGIGQLMASQLFGVHPADPGTIAAVTAGMAAVAWAAAWWPARRAGRIAPAAALKDA